MLLPLQTSELGRLIPAGTGIHETDNFIVKNKNLSSENITEVSDDLVEEINKSEI